MTLQRIITNAIENNAVDSTKIADNAVGITQLSVQADGNAGEFLQTNGAGILSFATAASTLTGGTGLTGMQVFDTAGAFTWTRPAGVRSILYFVTGGGAGGSGINVDSAGGQSGATVMGFLDVTNITSETGTVGNGGSGSTPGLINAAGSAGGNSNFGTHATAAGSTSSGGLLIMAGYQGDSADFINEPAGRLGAGKGGPSFWGGGPGKGGNGADGSGTGAGAIGNPGVVVILEFA